MPAGAISIRTMQIDGTEIRRTRKIQGVSQAAVAKMVGTGENVISSIERGYLQAKPNLIDAIAKALHVDVKSFYAEEPLEPQQAAPPIGKAIREARQAARFRQKDLADRVGCEDITISHIECSYRRPSRKLLAAITKALHLDGDHFRNLLSQTTGPDLSKPPAHIGQAIQRQRWATGMRQVDLARIVGCSVNIISHIERSNRQPSRKLSDAIGEALNLDLRKWPVAEDARPKQPAIPSPSYLGEAIQRARRSAGLSQKQLGSMVGCHRVDVDRIEVGHRHQPPREVIAKVAEALKVDLADWPDASRLTLEVWPPERPTSVGEAIQRARRAAGLKQRELAGLVGCGDGVISNIERGYRSPPRSLLATIAKVLHVEASDLAGHGEPAPADGSE